ncbi:MAG: hypothetical protein OXE99_07355 [Cellvibrionales bacterium]|nr:hypothetical protein [Cellvibrionales bacterium]
MYAIEYWLAVLIASLSFNTGKLITQRFSRYNFSEIQERFFISWSVILFLVFVMQNYFSVGESLVVLFYVVPISFLYMIKLLDLKSIIFPFAYLPVFILIYSKGIDPDILIVSIGSIFFSFLVFLFSKVHN